MKNNLQTYDDNKTTPSRYVQWSQRPQRPMWLKRWQMKNNIGSISEQLCTLFFPYFLFIAPAVVYLLFDCTLTGVKKTKEHFPLSTQKDMRIEGTHVRFVWYSHFLGCVYSQAFRALFCYFCNLGKQCVLIIPEKPTQYIVYRFEYCVLHCIS